MNRTPSLTRRSLALLAATISLVGASGAAPAAPAMPALSDPLAPDRVAATIRGFLDGPGA